MTQDQLCLIEFKVGTSQPLYTGNVETRFRQRRMPGKSREPQEFAWTAITVMGDGLRPMLCPFFGKCDGLLLIEAESGRKKFLKNERCTAQSLCQLIVKAGAGRLICGFIGAAERQTLRAAGIDIRLGSLASSVEELVACFCDLPAA